MSNLLAIFDTGSDHTADAATLDALHAYEVERVTVLVTGSGALLSDDGPEADAIRDRLAWLLTAIELQTGAIVSGLVGERSGGHEFESVFDAVVGDSRMPALV